MLPANMLRLSDPRRRDDLMRNRLFLACLTATLLALSLPLSLQGLVAPMPREQTRAGERGLALGSGPVRALPGSAKRFALVIGVDSYADSQVTALGGSVNDAHNRVSLTLPAN